MVLLCGKTGGPGLDDAHGRLDQAKSRCAVVYGFLAAAFVVSAVVAIALRASRNVHSPFDVCASDDLCVDATAFVNRLADAAVSIGPGGHSSTKF